MAEKQFLLLGQIPKKWVGMFEFFFQKILGLGPGYHKSIVTFWDNQGFGQKWAKTNLKTAIFAVKTYLSWVRVVFVSSEICDSAQI